jgi:hypothetical protein
MNRWPIERSWEVRTAKGERLLVRTSELRRFRACGLLGAAGLGKTFELDHLAALERADGADVLADRLAVLGQTSDGLASKLASLVNGATPNTALYLDALDEVMVPVQTSGLIIARWVKDSLQSTLPRIRLSCRSAVWPPGVQSAIEEVYGGEECAFAVLQPLSEDDVLAVASFRGIDGRAFLRAVDAAGVRALSEQPLTLKMMLNIHAMHGHLPKQRRDLFQQAMEHLASDRRERSRDGTAIEIPTAQLLEAAERIACYSLLSGRDVVDLSDSPPATAMGRHELEGLPSCDRPLHVQVLTAIGRSGLCVGDGPDRFRFAHRQYAEYLAGRRVATLLPHQAQGLLGAGSSGPGVAGPLREMAAFAAMESDGIAAWVTDHDPEVIGLSDVADPLLRRRATLHLLEKFRRHELTDSQTGRGGIELAGFSYPGAEKDLVPVLRERFDGCQDLLECAVELIESWCMVSMSDALADLMLDPTAPLQSRKAAGYALSKIGTPESRRRLIPLIAGSADDPEMELKGLSLQCNWPENISVPDLLAAMKPRADSNYSGAYDGFLLHLEHSGFDARGHRLQGLQWARQFARKGGDHEWTNRIAKRIAIASLDEIDQPGVAQALADLILDAADAHDGSPLSPPRRYSAERAMGEEVPVLSTKPAARAALGDALAARTAENRDLWWAARLRTCARSSLWRNAASITALSDSLPDPPAGLLPARQLRIDLWRRRSDSSKRSLTNQNEPRRRR